jgi:hypothetical protein
MTKPPLQREVEQELHRHFNHDDFETMAGYLGYRTGDYLSKLYNPGNPEKPATLFKGLKEIFAAKETRYELALNLYKTFDLFARKILFNGDKGKAVGLKDPQFRDSIFKFIGVELDTLPNTQKLKAVQDLRLELEKYEQGLRFNDVEDSEVEQVSNTAS